MTFPCKVLDNVNQQPDSYVDVELTFIQSIANL